MRCKTLARWLALTLLCSLSLMLCSCGTRFIVQQPGQAAVLRKPIKGAQVLGPDKDGNLVPGTADIPAGAIFAVPADK